MQKKNSVKILGNDHVNSVTTSGAAVTVIAAGAVVAVVTLVVVVAEVAEVAEVAGVAEVVVSSTRLTWKRLVKRLTGAATLSGQRNKEKTR